MSRPRRVVVAVVLVAVAALAGAEVALRAYGFGRGIRYRPHAALGWEMVPRQNAFNVRGRAPVRVNTLGFRGPEIPMPRPASTYRVLFLGDGSTLGNQTPEAATFPFLVRDGLQRRWPDRTVDIAVGAVSSYQLEQELELLRARAATVQPSAVVIGFCWNDWAESCMRGPGLGPEAFAEYRGIHGWRRLALADFAHRLDKIRVRFRQTKSFARGEGLPPSANDAGIWTHVEAMLDSLAATARVHGAEVVLLVIPARMTQHDAPAFAARRARLADWAARRGVRLADPQPAFAAASASGGLYLDEVHLGRAAQPLVAASVVDALAPPPPGAGS
jgi:hypothetical protein